MVDCYNFILDRAGEERENSILVRITADSIWRTSAEGISSNRAIPAAGKKKRSKRQRVCGVNVTSRTIAREECTEIGSIREKARSFAERADQYRSHMSLHSPADKLQFAVSP